MKTNMHEVNSMTSCQHQCWRSDLRWDTKIPREFSLIACEKLLKIYYNIMVCTCFIIFAILLHYYDIYQYTKYAWALVFVRWIVLFTDFAINNVQYIDEYLLCSHGHKMLVNYELSLRPAKCVPNIGFQLCLKSEWWNKTLFDIMKYTI